MLMVKELKNLMEFFFSGDKNYFFNRRFFYYEIDGKKFFYCFQIDSQGKVEKMLVFIF